ncbi:MAG: glycosyltransferase WbuB [Bradyrhizobium sp.]|nr:MAG: glycosyltransferase WbuB [Bradyrhizobium sp.]
MRILFFSHYYPPEVNAPASRTSEHCRAWAAKGHGVTVVTCTPNHPNGVAYPGYRNRLYQSEFIDGVRVIRIWTLMAPNAGFARRTLNYLSYLFAVALALPWLPKADVIVSTSPQFFCGLAGGLARLVKRAPWVLEIRDLWPESIVAVGAMRKGLATRFLEWLEGFAYRQADGIVSVTRSFVPHIAERCGDPGKIAVFVNGADLSAFVRRGDRGALRRSLGLEGRFIGAYMGTHGMAHGLATILDAAEILKHDARIAFLMVGDGAERAHLQAEREARGLDNVLILGQRPKAEMPDFWSAADASLILLKRSETFTKVLPSKMAEAMAMQCPIILGVEGEARATLEEARAGIAIPPEDARALADAMTALADDPNRAAAFGRAGLDYARANFDRRTIAARYLDFLADVAARRPLAHDLRAASGASAPGE